MTAHHISYVRRHEPPAPIRETVTVDKDNVLSLARMATAYAAAKTLEPAAADTARMIEADTPMADLWWREAVAQVVTLWQRYATAVTDDGKGLIIEVELPHDFDTVMFPRLVQWTEDFMRIYITASWQALCGQQTDNGAVEAAADMIRTGLNARCRPQRRVMSPM